MVHRIYTILQRRQVFDFEQYCWMMDMYRDIAERCSENIIPLHEGNFNEWLKEAAMECC